MAAEIHVGDVGTSFRATIKNEEGEVQDISSATVKKMIFEKSDDTVVEKDAVFVTDGTDGLMEYVSVDGFLDMFGRWEVQGYVELEDGSWHSDIHKFKVFRNLN